jgi:hypothetical protein
VRPLALTGNVAYNFEGGRLHPFVTGGVGMYRYVFDQATRMVVVTGIRGARTGSATRSSRPSPGNPRLW